MLKQTRRIVAVDDEEAVLEVLRQTFMREGFEVHCARAAADVVPLIEEVRPDLLIIDVTLPDASGFDLTKEIRKGSNLPILILSARGDEVDRILGLELGADDYVTKPFSPRELVGRVKAILRRTQQEVPGVPRIAVRDLLVDLEMRQVYVHHRPVNLTKSEFAIVQLVAENPDRAFSRAEILAALKDEAPKVDERAVDAHVHNLREKIEDDPSNPAYLVTVRGFGYRLKAQ